LALADTASDCYWLDRPERPAPHPALAGREEADLVIAGGGFTGLWAALQAKEANPTRDVVLLEAKSVGEGASGRNGGFSDPSLTHGVFNGLRHFPKELETLEQLGLENYRELFASLKRHGIDADVEENGTLSVATAPYQVEDLREHLADLQRFGHATEWFDRDAVRAQVNSPTFLAGIWSRTAAIVDPARLTWGLRDTILRLGVRLYEGCPVEKIARAGAGIELRCASGSVRSRKAVLATNAFRSPLYRMRRASIPVWDYALMTEPLSKTQLESVGWRNRQGVGDSANHFHYYRLTRDNRILWGGYDAIYHFGSRTDDRFQQRSESFTGLSRRFFQTFPQLQGLRFSHQWGGPISTTTRFCLDVGTAHGRRVSWAIGYTGLGVVASRFGARVALDLLDRPEAPHLGLDFVRKRSVPWPPEPIRSIAVQLTQRALARADENEGQRGPWLRVLDFLGLGFDS
jgi:glycine/D-amino acid oxidase-like deaminating enzyme